MMDRQAIFSLERKYRYLLQITWDETLPPVSFIGMNPSLANEERSDPTITRIVNFVKSWGGGSLTMLNLFALVSPYPRELGFTDDPIGPDNTIEWIREKTDNSMYKVAAWGEYQKYVSRKFRYRWLDVAQAVPNLHCLRQSKITGMPSHPLYLPAKLRPETFHF